MKQLIGSSLLLLFFIAAVSSCKVGDFSEARGKPQEAYIQAVNPNPQEYDSIDVYVDDQPPFKAKVDKLSKRGVKGNVYTIPTGRHRLKVVYKGRIIFDEEIFTSSQEVKQIRVS